MRVISGSARGRRLASPAGDRVRPTLDRVREALFSAIAPDLPGTSFLDLYAGSGANGIEALSRGAASAVFVDTHPQSQGCIRKNLETTGFTASAEVMSYRAPEDLSRIRRNFDFIFADPPHELKDYEGLIVGIDASGILNEGGLLIVEHHSKQDLPESAGALNRQRERRYGQTTLSFYA